VPTSTIPPTRKTYWDVILKMMKKDMFHLVRRERMSGYVANGEERLSQSTQVHL